MAMIRHNGKRYHLGGFIKAKRKEWFDRDLQRGHDRAYAKKGWEDEGIVWAIQDYYGSMGEFSNADIKTIEKYFGAWADDIINLCEG